MSAATRRSLYIVKTNSADSLQLREEPVPSPPENDNWVKVEVKYVGLNFGEVMMKQGLYRGNPPPPFIPGWECSGIVLETGSDVTTLAKGDRILAANAFGTWSSIAFFDATHCFKIPESLSLEHAASIPVNALTAYMMLFIEANIRPGQKVLIHMAAGGVGTMAIQLCRTVPNVTIIGTASAPKHEFLKKLGVDHCIDYRTQDYAAEVEKLVGKVDIILDALGGRDTKKSMALLRPLGRIVVFGMANAVKGGTRRIFHLINEGLRIPKINPLDLMAVNRSVSGFHLGHLLDAPETFESMRAIIKLIEEGKLVPHIDSTFAVEDAVHAFAQIEERKNVGKVLMSFVAPPPGDVPSLSSAAATVADTEIAEVGELSTSVVDDSVDAGEDEAANA